VLYSVPKLLISGSTYAQKMEIHCLNYDGSIMTGIYYPDAPTDTIGNFEAFICTRADTTITSINKLGDLLSAHGINTNGWVFRDVTAMSDDGNTLAGYGETNGVVHGWLVQAPPAVIQITNITVKAGTVTIDFTGTGLADNPGSFAVQQADTLVNAGTAFTDVSPAATFTGTAPSFQATLSSYGDAQFYRIRHL
jgi:hypothetical protein